MFSDSLSPRLSSSALTALLLDEHAIATTTVANTPASRGRFGMSMVISKPRLHQKSSCRGAAALYRLGTSMYTYGHGAEENQHHHLHYTGARRITQGAQPEDKGPRRRIYSAGHRSCPRQVQVATPGPSDVRRALDGGLFGFIHEREAGGGAGWSWFHW